MLGIAYLVALCMQMMQLLNVLRHSVAITAFIFGTRPF